MKTPICDFIRDYAKSDSLRLHMPGHKGKNRLGFEQFDITEFTGADSLYHADGIIKESEENLSRLFGTQGSFYSCEGSSLSIRAMLYLAKLYGDNNYIMAGRNAHSSLISASALIGFDIEWLYSEKDNGYLSCNITPTDLENRLRSVDKKPFCVYVTSPDYLGNICDIQGLGNVCEKYGTMLVVDNAHGAYLKFLEKDLHPISNGAVMCCDSAHKTLPVLTGGAYLHIGKNAPSFFTENAKSALALFGTTSPSYLILASLDNVNRYLSQEYKTELSAFVNEVSALKQELVNAGYCVLGDEPIKITVDAKKYGYTGTDFAKIIESKGLICEFFDKDFVVLMLTPEHTKNDLDRIQDVFLSVKKKAEIHSPPFSFVMPKKRMSIRDASLCKREKISIDGAKGRILASTNVFCPPAVSLIVCGEEFDENIISLCKQYGFDECHVTANT